MMLLEFFGNFSFMLFLVVENLGFFFKIKKKKDYIVSWNMKGNL